MYLTLYSISSPASSPFFPEKTKPCGQHTDRLRQEDRCVSFLTVVVGVSIQVDLQVGDRRSLSMLPMDCYYPKDSQLMDQTPFAVDPGRAKMLEMDVVPANDGDWMVLVQGIEAYHQASSRSDSSMATEVFHTVVTLGSRVQVKAVEREL
jgi:hypothetical protein